MIVIAIQKQLKYTMISYAVVVLLLMCWEKHLSEQQIHIMHLSFCEKK